MERRGGETRDDTLNRVSMRDKGKRTSWGMGHIPAIKSKTTDEARKRGR
jgi:hypothetical protein